MNISAMNMNMVFHTGIEGEILFAGWKPVTLWQFVLSCLVCYLYAVFYEFFRAFRHGIFEPTQPMTVTVGTYGSLTPPSLIEPETSSVSPSQAHSVNLEESDSQRVADQYAADQDVAGQHIARQQLIEPPTSSGQHCAVRERQGSFWNFRWISLKRRLRSPKHTVDSLAYGLQTAMSLILMLLFMTYNVWICLSVVLGAGTGYYLFGWHSRMQPHCI